MKCAGATKLHRKSGGSPINRSEEHRAGNPGQSWVNLDRTQMPTSDQITTAVLNERRGVREEQAIKNPASVTWQGESNASLV
jgi:hypothetical protein